MYSYLQEWLPHVGQRAVRDGATDFVGLGRMVLTYPELPADVLAGRALARKRICRTFSDCTTAPRNGLPKLAAAKQESKAKARTAAAASAKKPVLASAKTAASASRAKKAN